MSHYQYLPEFLYKEEADFLYEKLLYEIPWRQVKYYKPERGLVTTPRLTWVAGFHQDDFYPLSLPQKIFPNKIPTFLNELKDLVESQTSKSFNYILFSLYRDGDDSISPHSDDEKFLGPDPTIVSLTVGQQRDFVLTSKATREKEIFKLSHGDLFIMQNNCQKDYLHSVPKTKDMLKPRISLTFRNALTEAGSKNYYKYNFLNTIL